MGEKVFLDEGHDGKTQLCHKYVAGVIEPTDHGDNTEVRERITQQQRRVGGWNRFVDYFLEDKRLRDSSQRYDNHRGKAGNRVFPVAANV